MHRVHHQRGRHCANYSDLPIWDLLFGTFNNPKFAPSLTGFPDHNELRVKDLLFGKKVKI